MCMCAYGCVGKSVDVRVWVCNEWPCNINCILQAKVVLTGVVNRGPNLVWVFCLWGLYLCVCVARQLSLWMNSCTCVVHVWLCRCLCVKLPDCVCVACGVSPWLCWPAERCIWIRLRAAPEPRTSGNSPSPFPNNRNASTSKHSL